MNNFQNIIIKTFMLINIYLVLINSSCPPPESIFPCKCYNQSMNIQCIGSTVNSVSFLEKLENTSFNILYIHETNISSFGPFGNSSWNKIQVQNNKELKYIHEMTFKKGPKQTLWISNNPKLDNLNLFKAIQHIEDTETIQLDGNEIKSFSFNNNSVVKYLKLHNNKISKIQSNIFSSLKELIELGLDHNMIANIEDFGLNFTSNNGKERKIVVSLNDNKLIDTSFTSKAFTDNKLISLDIDFENNDFTTISEEVFGSLVKSKKNKFNFENIDFNCNCDMLWLLNETTKPLVTNIGCVEQKKSLYDLTASDLKCSSIPTTINATSQTKPATTIVTTITTTITSITTNKPTTNATNHTQNTTPTKQKTTKTKKPTTDEIISTTTAIPPKCPLPEDITPCICDQNLLSIQCFGKEINNSNIYKIGTRIQSITSKFNLIRISSTSLTEIPKFVLLKANFNNILIEENANLERIDSEVFAKSQIQSFIIRNNPNLSDSNVYELVKNLDPIEVILSGNALKAVPENAFVNEENPRNARLTRILLDHNNIEVIDSNAFTGLSNLSYLSLEHNMIATIEDYGIKLSSASSHLKILLNNNKLNSQTFTMRSIDISQTIALNLNLAENELTILSENIFKNFLNRTKAEINFHGNKFLCDCNTKWLLNESLNKNALNILCDNKQKNLLDLTEKDLVCILCPIVDNINPCTCNQTSQTLQCNGQSINDELIKTIGPKIKSNTLSDYKLFIISETNIKNLSKSVFSNANFSFIDIKDNKYLSRIDPKIFNKNQIISLKIINNKDMSDYNVYELAKSLNPIVVNFSNNAIEEIPEFAFIENQNSFNSRISVIILDNNRIESIPSNAFIGLSNLTILSLNHNLISTIDDFGLKLTTIDYIFVKLFLNNNNLIDSSFASKSIDISENITISLYLENNSLTTLNENLFKPLFLKYNNQIILNKNKFICDCHMKWLLNEPQSKHNEHIECHNKNDLFIFQLTKEDLKCE